MRRHKVIAIALTVFIWCPLLAAQSPSSESLADVARRAREAAEKRASSKMTFSNETNRPADKSAVFTAENPFSGLNPMAAGYDFKTIPRQWPDCRTAQADTVGKSIGTTEMAGKPSYSGNTVQSNGAWTFTGKITIDAKIVVTMPDWVNIPNDPATHASWRSLLDLLRLHEEGHVNIYKEFIRQLNGASVIASGPTANAAQQAAQRYFDQTTKSALDATNARQERYDAVTDHGRKQSAVGGKDVGFVCTQ
jgi:predicted secreted Zn-dependent protease